MSNPTDTNNQPNSGWLGTTMLVLGAAILLAIAVHPTLLNQATDALLNPEVQVIDPTALPTPTTNTDVADETAGADTDTGDTSQTSAQTTAEPETDNTNAAANSTATGTDTDTDTDTGGSTHTHSTDAANENAGSGDDDAANSTDTDTDTDADTTTEAEPSEAAPEQPESSESDSSYVTDLPAAAAANPNGSYTPSPSDIDAAARVLATTDSGTESVTLRWPAGTVTVAVQGPDTGSAELQRVDNVLQWLTNASGVNFTRTTNSAAFTIVLDRSVNRPTCQLTAAGNGTITSATATLSPHRERWLWEEVVQCAGPAADHGPSGRSIFVNSHNPVRPTAFDAWVVRELYRTVGAGATPDQVKDALS